MKSLTYFGSRHIINVNLKLMLESSKRIIVFLFSVFLHSNFAIGAISWRITLCYIPPPPGQVQLWFRTVSYILLLPAIFAPLLFFFVFVGLIPPSFCPKLSRMELWWLNSFTWKQLLITATCREQKDNVQISNLTEWSSLMALCYTELSNLNINIY